MTSSFAFFHTLRSRPPRSGFALHVDLEVAIFTSCLKPLPLPPRPLPPPPPPTPPPPAGFACSGGRTSMWPRRTKCKPYLLLKVCWPANFGVSRALRRILPPSCSGRRRVFRLPCSTQRILILLVFSTASSSCSHLEFFFYEPLVSGSSLFGCPQSSAGFSEFSVFLYNVWFDRRFTYVRQSTEALRSLFPQIPRSVQGRGACAPFF